MPISILIALVFGFSEISIGQDNMLKAEAEVKQVHIQLHEKMMQTHQQAVDCLKSGKPEDECAKAFHRMCKEASGHRNCGPWMTEHMQKRDKKRK